MGPSTLCINSKPFSCKDTIRVCRYFHHLPLKHLFLFLSLVLEKTVCVCVCVCECVCVIKMEDQYEMGDLRQCIDGRALLPPISQPPDLLSGHSGFPPGAPHYEMLMVTRGLHHEFLSDSTNSASFKSASTGGASSIGAVVGGFDMDAVGFNGGGCGGDIGSNGRWPRQETLTLLEIRSRFDHKFKEANQKGPLWDEVSRIMSEEHGYQRSGKKCREKFENLYKYYKKTKEGKAGRQDGKHYRFFRQLEALYGETNNGASASEPHIINYKPSNETYAAPRISDNNSLSLSNSSDFNTTSSDDSEELHEGDTSTNKRKKSGGKRSWKAKIRDFIDSKMSKLMAKQEDWMENVMTKIEHKEQERILREEEWRKQDAERIEREQKFWANERAWIEGRDSALMEALQKLNGKDLIGVAEIQNPNNNVVKGDNDDVDIWPDREITRLFQIRASMEQRFQQSGLSEEVLWEEIATKMACFGHERSGLTCKEKWVSVNNYLLEVSYRRRENQKGCYYNEREAADHTSRLNDNGMNDFGFRCFMGDGDNTTWENYAQKLNKGYK